MSRGEAVGRVEARSRALRGRRPTSRAMGAVILAAGLALMALVQLQWHTVPRPLFDGVVVSEPYRYLHPGPGQPGDPTSYSDTQKVGKGSVPLVAAYTSEMVPQVQMFSQGPGGVTLSPGAKRITTSIRPVDPPGPVMWGTLAGNAYEILVTDDLGGVASMIPDKPITLAMRAPENSGNATIAIFADGGWQDLHAEPSGLPDIWVTTTLPGFGTFAVIVPGTPEPCPSPSAAAPSTTAVPPASAAAGSTPSAAQSPPSVVSPQPCRSAAPSPGV